MSRQTDRRLVKRLSIAAALACAASLCSVPAQAQREHSRGHPHAGGGQPHARGGHQWGGDIGRFHQHDWGTWRGGHWSHARHGGRLGWWWVVGPSWYYYSAPIYPYPNPWEPAEVIVVPPANTAPPLPPTQYWYYCESSQTYYPYAANCPGGWKQVPAKPEGQ